MDLSALTENLTENCTGYDRIPALTRACALKGQHVLRGAYAHTYEGTEIESSSRRKTVGVSGNSVELLLKLVELCGDCKGCIDLRFLETNVNRFSSPGCRVEVLACHLLVLVCRPLHYVPSVSCVCDIDHVDAFGRLIWTRQGRV